MHSLVDFRRVIDLPSIGTSVASSFWVESDVWTCISFEMSFLLACT